VTLDRYMDSPTMINYRAMAAAALPVLRNPIS
jgi:hypothetical protein